MPNDTLLSVEALHADLDAWESAIRTRHPRWHGRTDDAALAEAFAAVRSQIQAPLSRREAFRRLSRVNPALGDAHALLMPTSIAPERGDAALLPFDVRVVGDRILLQRTWRRASDGRVLTAGSSILAINGESARHLLADFDASGHGETPALRRAMLGVLFGDWLYALRGWESRFSITLEGEPEAIAIGPEDGWRADVGDEARWSPRLDRLDDAVAWLRLPTFDVDEDPEAFEAAINGIFSSLRRDAYTGLVIDIRGNTGGQSDAGGHVASHLVATPILPASRAVERLHADNNGWLDWRGAPGTMREISVDEDVAIKPAPAPRRFTGRVVLLIDGMTYSAAIVFATTLQDHGLATLVGTPTEGFGNQTGNMAPYVLPNSGLLAYIPAREFIRPNGDPARAPVVPDLTIPTFGRVEDEALDIARRIASGERISRAAP